MKQDAYLDYIRDEIIRLINTKPLKKTEYYNLNLFVDDQNRFYYEMETQWTGFTKTKPLREIRIASIVEPEIILANYKRIKEPMFIINNERDFLFFVWVTGGNSIIEQSIANKFISHLLSPSESAHFYDKGFININSVPKENLARVATPKLRMKIFNRDNRRCKICGGSPANSEHIELHLHHIIPYSSGGMTEENNLITLCHTCHKGLHPHLDYSLFDNIGVKLLSERLRSKPFLNRLSRNILALNKLDIQNRRRKKYSK